MQEVRQDMHRLYHVVFISVDDNTYTYLVTSSLTAVYLLLPSPPPLYP